MSDNKHFISMVNLIQNISDGSKINESFNRYLDMIELLEDVETQVDESEMTKELEDKREEYVLDLKKKKKYFQQRYGDEWESVLYGTATNLAKKDLGMN